MSSPTEEPAPLPVDLSDEPLVGWRCWFVLPHEVLLRPIYKRGLVWKPREAIEALCPEHLHEVPADDCKCGVWTVCHPMLLEEIGWRTAPPQGTDPLPGVIVAGEVSLWGKIIQHERGWRAGLAYPRHLYAFTDDPMIAETLRERYGVPVEWGADAERLRRFLPGDPEEDDEPEPAAPAKLADVLLGVVDAGLVPAAVRELVVQMLKHYAENLKTPPPDRIKECKAALAQTWRSREDRQRLRRWLGIASAEAQALDHTSYLDASRAVWVRLVQWQRHRGLGVLSDVQGWQKDRDRQAEDLRRGTHPRTGAPYAPMTLYAKRRHIETLESWMEKGIEKAATQVEQLTAVEIPTYRAWRAMMAGLISAPTPNQEAPAPPTEELRACHQALMRRHDRLAEQERLAALERALVIRDREAFEEEREAFEEKKQASAEELDRQRAALESERGALREDLVAGVKRDHAELLAEVGELERRRRAALAMLPGPWSPDFHRVGGAAVSSSPIVTPPRLDLRERMDVLGITLARVARTVGCTSPNVSKVLSGRSKSRRVIEGVEALIAQAEAEFTRRGEAAPAPSEPLPRGLGRVGVGHPALSERLREAGIIHADVAIAAGCSGALVAQVLNGRTAEVRGKTTTIVQTAERLLAEKTGDAVADASPAMSAPRSLSTVRDALVRERAELDALRRRILAERETTRAELTLQQRRIDAEKRTIARTAEVARLRHIAAGLPRRLDLAGITRTQLAHAARRNLSEVSRVLSGYATNAHVVEVAERLLAKKRKRLTARPRRR
jgi:hypothetical protein